MAYPFPSFIPPMLATLVDKAPKEGEWIYEIKWDGFRALAFCNKGKVSLLSRNDKSFNERFSPIVADLEKLKVNAVLDGEIVVLNDFGISSFESLQNWQNRSNGELVYFVFDLLWLDGKSLLHLPLWKRKELLKGLLPKKGKVLESQSFLTKPEKFLKAAKKMGIEGMIAKKTESPYRPGERGTEWLKIKVLKTHEVVIGGYTKNRDSPKLFSALLVGVYKNKTLIYTGKIGTGFSDKMQKEMMLKFKPLITDASPFSTLSKGLKLKPTHEEVTWLIPKLVCQVKYTEVTNDGVMRHPSFEGMREDKKAKDVKEEIPIKTRFRGASRV